MTKEAIFKRIALEDGYVTDKSMFAVEDDRDLVYKAMDEFAKQQVITFIKDSIQKGILHATTDEAVVFDGLDVYWGGFDKAVSNRYDQFLEHQKQNNQ